MYDWVCFITLSIIIYSIYNWLTCENYFEKHDIIHEKPLPIVGNSSAMLIRNASMAEHVQKIYNLNREAKYVGFYEFNSPVIMIRDPELMKNITIKSFDHFVDHRQIIDSDREPFFKKNLLALRGDKWREIRNLLSPAFTASKMRTMFKLMSNCAETFADYLAENGEKESCIDSKDAFSKYTNDVIATCAFGVKVDSMRNPTNEFYMLGKGAVNFNFVMMMKFFMLTTCPSLAKLLGVRLFDKKVEMFFKEVVKNTIETRDREGITRPDMIQLMMEARNNRAGEGPNLSIEDMTAQAFIFFIGGFETTATLMCFAAHLISVNPEVQRKLQEEVDNVYEQCKESPTYDAINGMKYLEAVINEAIRLYPIMPVMDRICTKSFELPPALPGKKPVLLKPGDIVLMAIYGLHRDPDHFPNPNEFYPERFIDDPKGTLHSPAYVPFGIGPRMCIGNRFALLEIKVLLFYLIAKCALTPGEKMILPLELNKKTMVMQPKGGFWLSLKPRNKWKKKNIEKSQD